MKKIFTVIFILGVTLLLAPTVYAAEYDINSGQLVDLNDSKYDAGDTFRVLTTESVIFKGTKNVHIDATLPGSNIFLQNVTINAYEESGLNTRGAIKFIGAGNTLTVDGTNSLKGNRNPAILVESGTELTIKGTGSLTASGDMYSAGIGSAQSHPCGIIIIESGTINAYGGLWAAGIGGGNHNGSGGSIIISGGTVKSIGTGYGVGIGGNGSGSSSINISGGTITAEGGTEGIMTGGEGIGGSVDSITISGTADITATGGSLSAGIGGKNNNITIQGGTVVANGGYGAAGIGGAYGEDGCDIVISDGDITAIGDYGAGIGGGNGGNGGDITISGGIIKASTKPNTDNIGGAGIGGSNNGEGSTSVTIRGNAQVYADGNEYAQDIGNGNDGAGSVSLQIDGVSAVFLRNNLAPTPTTSTHVLIDSSTVQLGSAYGFSNFPTAWNDSTAYGYIVTNTLSFDVNTSGTGTVTNIPINQILSYDTKATAPASEPLLDGYHLEGWYKENGCINKWDFDTDTVTTDTILYANWESNTYSIKFNGNGNTSGSMSDQILTYGTNENLTTNNFARTGYTFADWFVNPDCTGTNYANGASVTNLTNENAATLNLYAKWDANTYTVNFNGNGSTSGSMSDQNCTYNQPQSLANNSFERTDYNFIGWNTSANGTGDSYRNAQSVSNLTDQPGATVTLYAQWKKIAYVVTYNANNGVSAPVDTSSPYDDGDKVTVLDTGSMLRTGYIFKVWNTKRDGSGAEYNAGDKFTMLEDNVTLYAIWERDPNVKINPGGTGGGGVITKIITPENIEKISTNVKGKDVSFDIKMDELTLTLNGTSFSNMQDEDVEINVQRVDSNYFDFISDGEFLEGVPVFDISLIVDGVKVPFNTDVPVEIKIEVELDGDYENHKVVAVYINESGEIEILEGFYDGKILSFSTNHFSNYSIMYIDKSFEDTNNHWSQEAVEALAARGVIEGKSETSYAPSDSITRAEFVTLIVRYFNFVSFATDLGYTDVSEDTWYTESVLTAREIGILPELYGDTFEPTKKITREEMMYILHKAILTSGKELIDEGFELDTFIDKDTISEYAVEGADYLVSRDIIHGTKNMISPTDTTTRAEVAQMLYNMLKKLNEQ